MKPTILIVDDEVSNVEYVVNILCSKYDLKVAYDGLQALKILKTINVDLILLDINMPNMDGYSVANHMSKDKNIKEIPFIYLTASNNEEDIVKGFEHGAVDFITKPFNKKELEIRVKNHINTHLLQEELKESLIKIKSQQKMLIQQSRFVAMGEMTAMLAHQWRQPLNVVAILVQEAILKFSLSKLDEKDFDVISSKITNQLKHMSHTIDDFRSFLTPNTKKDNFNLKETLESSFNITQPKLEYNYIKYDINIKNNNCLDLYGYESEIKQVFINITNNAIDAIIANRTEDEKRFIEVVVSGNKEHVQIDFIDNGKGIKEEVKDTLFDPYVTTKNDLNGSGLGLYMSKLIIEKNMNGNISVKNTLEGACFSIVFNKDKK